MQKNHLIKGRICLLVCLSVLLTACGGDTTDSTGTPNKEDVQKEGNALNAKNEQEWVYVPERIEIRDEKADYEGMNLIDDTVCYVSMNGEAEEVKNVCRYSLSSRELVQAPIEWPMEGSHRDVVVYAFNPDCSVWLIVNVYPADFSQMKRFLCRFDAEGKSSFCQDVTEQLGSGVSMDYMAVDGQGRIGIFSNEYSEQSGVWLYSADGSYCGTISYDLSENFQVRKAVRGEDGRLYACVSKGENPGHCTLAEVDFERQQLIGVIEDFPDVNGLNTGAGVAENQTEQSGASDKQYDFLLYDNNYAYGYDFNENNKKQGSSGGAAEELFLWMDSNINGYFVMDLRLLKDGRYYTVVEDWVSEDRSIVLLTKTRTEEAPKRENLVLATVNGESELVGMAMRFNRENYPWHLTVQNYDSLDDLYAVADNPKTVPFDGLTRDEMMQYIMMFNEETFIDWDTGACRFDSDTFRAVLELCGRFPDAAKDSRQSAYEFEEVPLPDKIQEGEVLFAIADIIGLKTLQPYMGLFGENAACIGFPTREGNVGTLLFPSNAFGIAAVSEHKEGAWKFIESILTREQNSFSNTWFGYFPAMKADMNRIAEERIKEDAERVARGKEFGEYYWSEDFFGKYHATTWDEVNDMLALVAEAIPAYQVEDDEIIKIIGEEAQAYYRGQKSAEAVAEIIQNRVRLYVRENL